MSSESAPSRKRARVDDGEGDRDSNLTTSGLQKDDDVWLSDGNIVVVATDKVAFRVHKSILSLRSEIFCDLFSLPDADVVTAETMDGHPVVHVSDSPDDIRRLFLVLCCGKNYYYNRDVLVPVPFEVLASLIRMAHKYAIQDVLDDALSRLKKFYTHDLSAWQDPDARARYVTTTDADAPQVVELAHLTNTPLLLPTAYLVCVRLGSSVWVEDDGSLVESAISSLSAPEQAQLMHAKGCLTQGCATRVLRLLAAVPCTSCTSLGNCMAARDASLDMLRDKGYGCISISFVSDEYALRPLAEELWDDDNWARFCGSCQDTLTQADKSAMKALWKSLPTVFNVDIEKAIWRNGDGSAGTGQ